MASGLAACFREGGRSEMHGWAGARPQRKFSLTFADKPWNW